LTGFFFDLEGRIVQIVVTIQKKNSNPLIKLIPKKRPNVPPIMKITKIKPFSTPNKSPNVRPNMKISKIKPFLKNLLKIRINSNTDP